MTSLWFRHHVYYWVGGGGGCWMSGPVVYIIPSVHCYALAMHDAALW